jgi:hypothetical protein
MITEHNKSPPPLRLSEIELQAAISHVRAPNSDAYANRGDRDLYELGARRLLWYLQKNGYTITKA